MRYNNYHKHTHYSNIVTLDVIAKPEDYMKRAQELGHTTYFTTEHGYNGNIYEALTLAEKYNLKIISGLEAYYVSNRYEKDKSNYHLMLIALNNEGYKELNYLLSKSNLDGFYYKPRIDDELLFSINPKNIIITTACIAGRLREEKGREEWILKMKNYFKNNFYLEVQAHTCKKQADYNKMILEYHKKYNIPLIHANDSHYIKQEDSIYRNLFLQAKGINYPEENDFILDYPDDKTIIERYHEQGVLNNNQIKEALDNTLIFDNCENLDINKEIKMPHLFDNPSKKLEEILNNQWKTKREFVPHNLWKKYLNAIREEVKVVEETNMSEYFLLNYTMIKNATENYNGVITKTGRGSSPSFYINNLLNLTDIDRVNCPVTLFPSRFMSKTRILETKSLPDEDFNVANQQPFYEASKELLGKDGCWWMLAYKPLQTSSAFRLYCKSKGLNIGEYNDIAIELSDLTKNKKSYLESNYYKQEKWKKLMDESQNFVGVIESVSQHPCSTLLMDKEISKEVGLIKVGDVICANITSYESDNYKYLKNDLLAVTVWDIIDKVCKLANIKIPTIKELDELLDDKTFAIYEKGLTSTINQVDSHYATNLVKRYKPKNVSEMSSFVAILRPGCASLLQDFIDRKPYTTGVKELDELLKEGLGRMIFQESIMKYLIWLGIKEDDSYTVIKKIAKKKFKEKELKELKDKLLNGWEKQLGSKNHFEETWKIVEDASKYSFNCSHSLSYAYDSLYGAYLKSHYPLEYYTVALNFYQSDSERTNNLTQELNYFNIKLSNPKFRYSFGEYSCDKSNNMIYKGISSIKGLNKSVGQKLYEIKDVKFSNFYTLLNNMMELKIGLSNIIILAKLDFFSEFGKTKKILKFIDIYNELQNRKIIKKDKEYLVKEIVLKEYCKKETPKQYSDFNYKECLNYLWKKLQNEDISYIAKSKYQLEYFGYIDSQFDELSQNYYMVLDLKIRGKNRIVDLYQLKTGKKEQLKLKGNKTFDTNPFNIGDVLKIEHIFKEHKWVFNKDTEKCEKSKTEFENILKIYYVIEKEN